MVIPLATAFTFIEQRRQALAEEPIRHFPAAPTTLPHISQVDVMFGEEHRDSSAQRGIVEALACADMLERVSARPSPIARLTARFIAAVRAKAGHKSTRQPRLSPDLNATP